MATIRYAGDRFVGNVGSPNSDATLTGVLDGAYYINTGNLTQFVRRTVGGTSQWSQLAGGGGGGGTPGGDNTQVQFNNAGTFGGDADLTFTDGNRLNVNKLGISGNIYDSNNSIGEGGMVLTNEGTTGVNWKSIESVLSGVGGSGVANYVARWSDEDTITSGIIQDNGVAVGINQAADPNNTLSIKSIEDNANPLQISAHDGDSLLVFRQTLGDGRLSIKKDGGVETIRLDSDNVSYITGGNFGIGTASPARKLEVIQTTNQAAAAFETRENGGIAVVELRAKDLSNPTAGLPAAQGPALAFQGYNGSSFQSMATIFASMEATAAANDMPSSLLFLTTPDGSASATEKMRIKSDGNVGIGTTSPDSIFQVYSSVSAMIKLQSAAGNNDIGIDFFRGSDRKWQIRNNGNDDSLFIIPQGVNDADATFAINTTGNVSIGSTSSAYGRLFVDAATTTANTALAIRGRDASASYIALNVMNNADGAIFTVLNNGKTEITHAGGADLDVLTLDNNRNTASDKWGIKFQDSFRTRARIQAVNLNTGNARAGLAFEVGFSTDTVERMRINDNGNVGIGTDNPVYKFITVGGAGVFDVTNAAATNHHLTVSEGTPTDWRPYAGSTTATLQIQNSATRGLLLAAKSTGSQQLITSQGFDINVNATVGTNAGTAALSILSNGNVGIGTTSPSRRLEVVDSSAAQILAKGWGPDSAGNDGGAIQLGEESAFHGLLSYDNATSILYIDNAYNNSNGDIRFRTKTSSTAITPLTIKGGGNVGIGTNSPSHRLHVLGATTGGWNGLNLNVVISSSNTYANAHAGGIAFGGAYNSSETQTVLAGVWASRPNAGDGQYGGMVHIGAREHGTDNIEKVINVSHASVGIGTASPGKTLEVIASADNDGIEIGSSSGNVRVIDFTRTTTHANPTARIQVTEPGATHTSDMRFFTSDASGSVPNILERMRIKSDGNVGIGVTDPDAKLEIKGTAGSTGLTFKTTDSSSNNTFWIQDGGKAGLHYHPFVINQDNSDTDCPASTFFYVHHASAPFIIKNDGKVGIGTTDPGVKLNVLENAADWAVIIKNSNANGYGLSIDCSSNTGTTVYALATYTGAGTGFFVKNNGRAGIGTDQPGAAKLDIYHNGGFTDDLPTARIYHRNQPDSGNSRVAALDVNVGMNNGDLFHHGYVQLFQHFTGAAFNSPKLYFSSNSYNNSTNHRQWWGIQALADTTATGDRLAFTCDLSSVNPTATPVHIMSLLTNGNVGVGLTVPLNRLQVMPSTSGSNSSNASEDAAYFGGNELGGIGGYTGIRLGGLGTAGYGIYIRSVKTTAYGNYWNEALTFNVTRTGTQYTIDEAMRITSDSNVGIGTNAPLSKFNVLGTQGNWRVDPDSVSNEIQVLSSNTANTGFRTFRLRTNETIFDTGGSERMRILSDGKVGIGTTSPDELLHLNKTLGTTIVKAEVASNSTVGFEIKKTGSTTQNWRIVDGQTVNGVLEFYDVTDTATRLAIKGDGQLQFNSYGSGTHTGTTAYRLSVDSSGNIIETAIGAGYVDGSGTANTIPRWTDSDTIGDSIITVPSNTSVQMAGELTLNYTSPILNIGKLNTSTGNAKLRFNSKNGAAANAFDIQFVKTATEDRLDFLAGGATPTVSFLNGGQVGIGTTVPAERLHVYIAGNDIPLRVQTDNHVGVEIKGGASHDIYFLLADTATNAKIGWDHSATALKFNASASFNDNHLVVKSTGVGIGVADPGNPLQVEKSSSATSISNAQNDNALKLSNYSTAANGQFVSLGLSVAGTAGASADAVIANFYGSAGNSNLTFHTEASNTLAERMRIQSDGNVGIGTDAPASLLQLLSDGAHDEGAEIFLKHANNNTTDIVGTILFGNNVGGVAMIQGGTTGANNTGYISFSTDNAGTSSEKVRIIGDGNVGIGQIAPKADLHIGGSFSDAANDLGTAALAIKQTGTSAENGIYIERTGERKGYYIGISGVDGLTFRRNFSGTKSDIMSLTRDGNVGIGTTNPANALHVHGSADGFGYIRITDGGLGATATDGARIGYNSSALRIQNYENSNISFFTNNTTEALTIQNDGNVGIGTDAPATIFHIHTDSASAQEVFFDNNGVGPVGITFRTDFATDAGLANFIRFDAEDDGGNNTRYSTIESFIVDNTDTEEDGRLTFSTIVAGTDTETMHVVGGNVGIGINNPNARLKVQTSNTDVAIFQFHHQ